MATLLLGILLLLWGLSLLGIVAIGNVVLGVLALIVGILYIVSAAGVALPALPVRRVHSD